MCASDSSGCMSAEQVIQEVMAKLDDREIRAIRQNPSSAYMHFGLGLYIRNTYIHSGRMGDSLRDPDSESSEITAEIARRLLPEYESYPLAFNLAGDDGIFHSVHAYACSLGLVPLLMRCVERRYSILADAEKKIDSRVEAEARARRSESDIESFLVGLRAVALDEDHLSPRAFSGPAC